MIDSSPVKPPSALLSFTAENSRSYRDEVHLSLLAGRLSSRSIVRTLSTAGESVRVLPAAGIFGANASGKTTLLKAMTDIRRLVLQSYQPQPQSRVEKYFAALSREPFSLHPIPLDSLPEHVREEVRDSDERLTSYGVDLIVDGVRWLYSVKVGNSGVASESAYHFPKGRRALVFRRECDPYHGGRVAWGQAVRAQGQKLEQFTHLYALILSAAGAGGWDPLMPLFRWFQKNLEFADSSNRRPRTARTLELLEDQESGRQVLSLLRAADLGISDAFRDWMYSDFEEGQRTTEEVLRDGAGSIEAPDDGPVLSDSLRLIHDGPWGPSAALFSSEESLGTLVWAGLVGPVLDALEHGSVLLVDELDASLHPHLVRDLVELFQSPRTNPEAAQLIFNAHDVTLLGDSSDRTLSRDQVWITEKQPDGTTTLTPLSDFRPRHDEAIARRYMQGRYGGVPTTNPAEYVRATEPTDG